MAPTGPEPDYLPPAPDGTYPADASGNLRNQQDIWREVAKDSTVHPKRVELGKDIFRTNAEEMYITPTVAFTGSRRGISLNRNNAKNQPRNHVRDHFGYYSEAYYFEDRTDNFNPLAIGPSTPVAGGLPDRQQLVVQHHSIEG